MAEDLDNFFKKKKTKGKKKYTTSDSIKKAVEDSQKVEEQKKSLPNDEDTQINDPVRGNDHHWVYEVLYQQMYTLVAWYLVQHHLLCSILNIGTPVCNCRMYY